MTESTLFTAREADAAHAILDRVFWYVREYAKPEDQQAAQVAVLRLAIEILTKKECNEIQ